MISHILNQTCIKIETATDEGGDKIEGAETPLACRFRDIQTIEPRNNREDQESDGMVWFAPDAPVQKGDIFRHENEVFRIDRVTKARKFGEKIEFIKCLVEKYRNISGS